MAGLLGAIIFLGSLAGMATILFRKIPLLLELPEIPAKFNLKRNLSKLKEKVKTLNPLKYLSNEIFLQKVLSKIRIITLRFEGKISGYLQKLRERSHKKKTKAEDNYWQELNNSTSQEDSPSTTRALAKGEDERSSSTTRTRQRQAKGKKDETLVSSPTRALAKGGDETKSH